MFIHSTNYAIITNIWLFDITIFAIFPRAVHGSVCGLLPEKKSCWTTLLYIK
jgi:hypothetical protein